MPEDSQDKSETKRSDEEFLATARQRFEQDCSDEKDLREQALLDLRFEAGDQWEAAIKNERMTKGRPALTFNRCHTFVQQVSNEARQKKPQIKFVEGDGGDKDTADVMEGMARHIQYCSDAQIAYETAVEYSAAGSFGYFGFITDYCDDSTWDQELKVRCFFDPFAVYGILIPACFGMEPQHAFVVEDVPIEEYKRLYDTKSIDDAGWDYASKESNGWIGTDTVRVAEYWTIEYAKKTLKRKDPISGGIQIRTVHKPTIKSCKINGFEVLKDTETTWPGDCIPIVPVLGKQRIVDGKPLLFSVIRFQRDPQQLINYYKTRIAETLGTQPIQPWIVKEGQLKNHEREWAEQNTTMRTWLTVADVLGVNGQPMELPQRQVLEPPIRSLSEAAAQEIDDMKATAGIFDASLGARSNENSGLAIQRRQQQSNVTNMHFMDNLERAFKKGGLIIADLIPYIYDTQRMVRILGEDETPKIVKINAMHQDGDKNYHYKVGGENAGKYEEIVTMAQGFSTKRMESTELMTELMQSSPNTFPMWADIFFRNSDMAGADQLAERFKKMLPPNLQDQDDSDPASQVQALQAKFQQAQQQLQALDAFAKQLHEEQQGKLIEQKTKIHIEEMKNALEKYRIDVEAETKLAVAEISTKAQILSERNASLQEIELELHGSAHEAATQASDQAHERDMAERGHQQALEQGDQAAQNQAVLAQQAQQVSASPANG